VLLLIKGLGLGGAERLLVDVVSNSDRDRFDYEVAYVRSDLDSFVPTLESAGVPVHVLGGKATWDLRWLVALRHLLSTGGFDIVHSHLPYTAAFGRLVAASLRRRRRPVLVYTEHSLWYRAAHLTKLFNRCTIGMDSPLLVVSDSARDALPARLRGRARVIVHGVDRARSARLSEQRDALRREVRAELGLAEHEVLALTVANLRQEKGYDLLVESASAVVASGVPVHFVSVGDGPLRASLEASCSEGGISDRVTFLGRREDTLRLMTGSDVFVLPSHQEGLPVALMEAMSVGLPVVATTVGGVPDIVSEGSEGFLVPPANAELMAGAIRKLAEDPGLRARMGRAAELRSEQFDVSQAAASIEDVYSTLLDATSATGSRIKEGASTPLVLHVIPTALARGAQREARALADRLDTPGLRRHLVLNLFDGPQEVPVELSLGHVAGKVAARGFRPSLVLRLRSRLGELAPSVVVAHGGDPLKYLVPALPKGVPLVYYATGTFGASDRRAQVLLWRALMRRAAVVACEGEEVLAQCRDLLAVRPERLHLAPNGRDPNRFHPPSTESKARRTPGEPPVVAFVGALNKGKGPDVFVEVVASLRATGLQLRAVLCGDGPLRQELTLPCEGAGVEMLGSREDVENVMRDADVFVFPSRPTGEGMPGVLIEAGLSGLPVVATDVPGVRAIVEDGETGSVVPVDDVPAMARATASLVCDPELRERVGAAGRRRCEERFTIDRVARCWLSFLEPLLVEGS
jgi:glycosyltransferase involved in cell wall biosynthesis